VIRVGIVADVRLHRDGVAALLQAEGRFSVAATAHASGETRFETEVDVIVLDIAGEDGARLARRWADAGRPIVAVGIPPAAERVLAFAETGVLGFVERDASIDTLATSIEAAARGEASCPPRVATTLLRRIADRRAQPRPAPWPAGGVLTAREQQIVELIAQGMSNKEIGRRLYIEVATVKNHVHNILEKLQVSRRGEAVARLRLVSDTGLLSDAGRPAHLVSDTRAVSDTG
jgi:two-component system, NarL family, nitrate/nitrite response regulator NarL